MDLDVLGICEERAIEKAGWRRIIVQLVRHQQIDYKQK
jgi:hypothetical protein